MTNSPSDIELIKSTFMSICARLGGHVELSAYTIEEETVVLTWHVFGLFCVNGIAGLFTAEIDGDPGYKRTVAAFRRIDAKTTAFAFEELLDLFAKTDLRKPLPKRAVQFQNRFRDKASILEGALLNAESEIVSRLAAYIRINLPSDPVG